MKLEIIYLNLNYLSGFVDNLFIESETVQLVSVQLLHFDIEPMGGIWSEPPIVSGFFSYSFFYIPATRHYCTIKFKLFT